MTCNDVANAARLDPGVRHGDEQPYRCPRHDDQRPSLFVNLKRNVWMCGPCGAKGTPWQLAAHCAGVQPSDKPAVLAWLTEHGLTPGNGTKPNSTPATSRIVATYPYTDEAGKLLYEAVRYEPKDFKQRRPEGNGWTWRLNGVRRVLYHLPEVIKAETVYIVEGEKDVDNLRSIGLTATCNAGGTGGGWRPEYTECFKPHQRVVLIPDNDDPGRKHVQQVAESLSGKVASLKLLELPNLSLKGDVSDWLAAGGTRELLEELTAAAPEFVTSEYESIVAMRFTRLGDLLSEPDEHVRWLVEEHLPAGGDSLLVAKPKVGKSTLARCLALAVARGSDFLGFKTAQGPVFYLALEEKRAEVKRHFRAMGARDDVPIFVFCATAPTDGLAQLQAAAEKQKPALIIIDPLFRFTRVRDGNDYAAVTNALEPLHALARDTGAHVLAVHHLGKGDRQGGDAVLGSTALFAAVDTLLLMKRSDKYRTLSSIQRYGTDLEEITLEYDEDTRTLCAGVRRAEADEAEASKEIVEFLSGQAEPVEEKMILESVDGRRGVKVKALRQGVKDRIIVRTGAGKKNDTYRYSVSCSLVPDICREQTKQTSETGITDSKERPIACSEDFALSKQFAETRELAFSSREHEEFDV
jgi:hypothetical protein